MRDMSTVPGIMEANVAEQKDGGKGAPGEGVYHVNERQGRVAARGEDLTGREILDRVGLSPEKYELFTVVHGKTGEEIPPDRRIHVDPGDHFRATIRNTDYT